MRAVWMLALAACPAADPDAWQGPADDPYVPASCEALGSPRVLETLDDLRDALAWVRPGDALPRWLHERAADVEADCLDMPFDDVIEAGTGCVAADGSRWAGRLDGWQAELFALEDDTRTVFLHGGYGREVRSGPGAPVGIETEDWSFDVHQRITGAAPADTHTGDVFLSGELTLWGGAAGGAARAVGGELYVDVVDGGDQPAGDFCLTARLVEGDASFASSVTVEGASTITLSVARRGADCLGVEGLSDGTETWCP